MAGHVVKSPVLGCSIIFEDATTKNQAKAAYRRYLHEIGISRSKYNIYMAGIKIYPTEERGYHTYVRIT